MGGIVDVFETDEADERGEQDSSDEATAGAPRDEPFVESFEYQQKPEPAHESAGCTDGRRGNETRGRLAADRCGE